MKNITVVGAGSMGSGIAQVFALAGFEVSLYSRTTATLNRAVAAISKSIDRQIKKGTVTHGQKPEALNRIQTFSDLEEAVAKAGLVVEAVTEDAALKKDIFMKLDKLCPRRTILATTTSSQSVTLLAAVTKRADKVIGLHFMNPAVVIPLVELIRGYETSDSVTATVKDLVITLGKTPVEVNDSAGFIASRLFATQINEAVFSLYEGVAGVEEIDIIMKSGMGYPMGPLQVADYVGLDVVLAALQTMQIKSGNSKYAPCPLLVNMVAAGHCGVKTGKGFYEYISGTGEIKSVSKKKSVRSWE